MKKWELSRRTFLRGSGFAVALPLLDAMFPSWARAQAAGAIKPRLWLGYIPHGYGLEKNLFFPSNFGTNYNTPFQIRSMANYRDYVYILNNLSIASIVNASNMASGKHHAGSASSLFSCATLNLNGSTFSAGKTIDTIIYQKLQSDLYKPLRIGTWDLRHLNNVERAIAWDSTTSIPQQETSPQALFDALTKKIPASGGGTTSPTEDKDTQLKRGVLHYVNDDLKRLTRNLGKDDKIRVDEYTTALNAIDRQLASSQSGSGSPPPEACKAISMSSHDRDAAVPKYIKLMIDLSVMAFQCDITRIVSFVTDHELTVRTFPFLDKDGQYNSNGTPKNPLTDEYHLISHTTGSDVNPKPGTESVKKVKMRQIKEWEVSMFAYYLQQMKLKTENGRPLLDSTISFYGSGMENCNAHNHNCLPVLFVPHKVGTGAVTGPGKHILYANNTSIAQLWHWVLRQYGADLSTFGDSSKVLSIG